jgi:DNA-binding PadR family transcriptional regulator
MARSTIPSVSGKERVLLELLVDGKEPMYGLELVERSDGEISRGSVYVTLSRMEDKGLVTTEQEAEAGRSGIPRRLYRPTGLGERMVHALRHLTRSLERSGLLPSAT